MKRKRIRIPKGANEFIGDRLEAQEYKRHSEKYLYLLHLIWCIPWANQKHRDSEYTPIYSQLFRDLVHPRNANRIISFWIKHKIIECNKSYSTATGIAKGYRFTEAFEGEYYYIEGPFAERIRRAQIAKNPTPIQEHIRINVLKLDLDEDWSNHVILTLKDKDEKKGVKKRLFTEVLYGPIMMTPIFRMFQRRFPNVAHAIIKTKESNYKDLSYMMQGAESDLIIYSVGERLKNEGIYFFPIHDSIHTTEEHVETVATYIREEFKNRYNITPTLHFSKPDPAKIKAKYHYKKGVQLNQRQESIDYQTKEFIDKSHYFAISKTNRVYTSVCSLQKDVRQGLTYKGQPLYEIDLANSQPLFLVPVIQEFYGEKYNTMEDCLEYQRLCEQGLFWKEMEKEMKKPNL